jgi:2-polyprenyl-3-methyl-5-hydroxy-6-metoxy-1,4-benzoquinol methylase
MSFDRFAGRYTSILDRSVGSGGADYFATIKASYLAALLPEGRPAKILDYGCGVGLVSSQLAHAVPDAVLHGFDPSAESIAQVPEQLRARGRFSANLDELDRDYDLIFVANVMHHIPPPERPGVVGELARRLAPAGRLTVIEHNPLNPATRLVVARCPLDEDAILLPRRETERHLRNAGLQVARHDYITFFPRRLSLLRPLEARLGWLPLGAQYAVVATRA